jgi:hypothetical protein
LLGHGLLLTLPPEQRTPLGLHVELMDAAFVALDAPRRSRSAGSSAGFVQPRRSSIGAGAR